MRKDYCAKCGIAIQIPEGTIDNILIKSRPQEFQDGYYCQPCALVRVKNARGQK